MKRTPEEIVYASENFGEDQGVVVKSSVLDAEEKVLRSISGYKLLGTHNGTAFAIPLYGQYYMDIMSNQQWDLPLLGNLRPKMSNGFAYTVTESPVPVESGESAHKITFSKINTETQSQTLSGIILPKHKFNSVWLIPVF